MTPEVRRFEMVEGSSSKFWEIRVEGASYTVTFGRIGTAGQSKTIPCSTPEAAASEAEKLVREKTRKGYQEVGGAPNWRPPAHVGTYEHLDRFMNYKVTGFDPTADPTEDDSGRKVYPSLRELDRRVFSVGVTYDDAEGDFGVRLDALLADPRIGELRGLVIGPWFTEGCDEGPVELVEKLVANAHKLTSLEGIFVGDVIQEECEISWLHQLDYTPLLRALPNLREFAVRGGEGLRFANLAHPNLRTLTVQAGGLSKACVRDIGTADLPELRTLTLWLGVDDYGGDSTVADLLPILAGHRFPKLEHLGLQDSENQDAIAIAVASSALLGRLKGLDLSMGTLTDKGARALFDSPAARRLVHLNVRHHYLSPEIVRGLEALGPEISAGDRQKADGDDRYVEVSE